MSSELLLCIGGPADGQQLASAGETLRVSKNVSPALLAPGESPYCDYKRVVLLCEDQPFTFWAPTDYTHYKTMMALVQGYKVAA